jgi:hypothetical protein
MLGFKMKNKHNRKKALKQLAEAQLKWIWVSIEWTVEAFFK